MTETMTAAGFHEEWFSTESQDALAQLVRIVEPLPGLIVEIGAWEGRSTVAMANAAHPRTVHSCDTWQGSGHEESEALAAERDIYAQWRANVDAMTDGNVVEHRMGWREYVPTIDGPVALAFIDAEHSYVEVRDNIAALVPLMTPGGIICGDDVHHGPVQEAIVETLGTMVFSVESLWVWQMPTDPHGIANALLRVQHPELMPNDADVKNSLSEVAVLWKDYTAQVSPAVHAVSAGTAAYLEHVNFKRKPKRILDLGSGLSSAVLRLRGGDVTTVDTDEMWQARTAQFLAVNGLPLTGLLSLSERISGEFDLIFVDIANGQTREAWARLAARHLSPGGVIVFDDMQNEVHADAFADLCREHSITLYSLRHLTLDGFGRWAAVGVKSGEAHVAPLSLAERYADNCRQRSDINEHLPRMVDLVTETNAKHVIELGTRSGVSTIAWLHALEQTGGHLTSVDLEARPPIGDWPHWTFIQGDDLDPAVTRQLQPADIVFIDTSHHYRHTRDELEGYLRLVKPGGVICLHDTELEWPDGAPVADGPFPVKRALEGFVNRHGFACVNYPNNNGFAIVKVGNG